MVNIPQQPDRAGTPTCFAALDFETADHGRDSACAVGVVRVCGEEIVERRHWFIRPPRPTFSFTYLHGITWQRVAGEPPFAGVWPQLAARLGGVAFVAA